MLNTAQKIPEQFGLDRDYILQNPVCNGFTPITLGFIFDELSMGHTSKKIRSLRPDILPETISLARAHIRAVNGSAFSRISNAETLKSFSVLIDENISYRISDGLSRIFGKVASVEKEGMLSYKDPQVWEWAVNNGVDVILTKDRVNRTPNDLSYVAEHETRKVLYQDYRKGGRLTWPDMPMLLQLPGGVASRHEEIPYLIKRAKNMVFSYVDNRSTPRVLLNSNGVKPFATFVELLAREVHEQEYGMIGGVNKEVYDRIISGTDIIQNRNDMRIDTWERIFQHYGVEQVSKWPEERKQAVEHHIQAAINMRIPKNHRYLPS